MHAHALPWSSIHPRVDGDESKHGWSTKQAWLVEKASMVGGESKGGMKITGLELDVHNFHAEDLHNCVFIPNFVSEDQLTRENSN